MPRPETHGFQKPFDSGERREVGLAVITYGEGFAQCNCGKPFTQRRGKPRENAIDKHINTKHGGQGIRL